MLEGLTDQPLIWQLLILLKVVCFFVFIDDSCSQEKDDERLMTLLYLKLQANANRLGSKLLLDYCGAVKLHS